MIRKLLYLFRRQVLVWRLRRLERRRDHAFFFDLPLIGIMQKLFITRCRIIKLDATEMSKGDAHVVVR